MYRHESRLASLALILAGASFPSTPGCHLNEKSDRANTARYIATTRDVPIKFVNSGPDKHSLTARYTTDGQLMALIVSVELSGGTANGQNFTFTLNGSRFEYQTASEVPSCEFPLSTGQLPADVTVQYNDQKGRPCVFRATVSEESGGSLEARAFIPL